MQFKFLISLGLVPGMLAAQPSPSPSPVMQLLAVNTPTPIQQGMVKNCNTFYKVVRGDTCENIVSKYSSSLSLAEFYKFNPSINNACTNLAVDNYYCVGIATAFHIRTRYHTDCTGDVQSEFTVPDQGELCVNTDCRVGSLEIAPAGLCPNGQVQVSYWEGQGCTGKWFGYGYANRGQCRQLWTDGWKFRSLHFRCASQQDDCTTKKTCTFDPEPAQGVCAA